MKKNHWSWLLHDKKKEKKVVCIKIYLCLALILGGSMFQNVFAQTERLTLKREKATMLDIILAVEKQSKMTFVYSMDAVNKIGKITLDVKNVLIDSVMNICLKKTDYTYSLDNNIVIIKKRTETGDKNAAMEQNRKVITGTVCDKEKVTLPGVSVYIKGTTVGVVTDVDGAYKLEVPANAQKLVFSFVGMETREVELGKETTVNVVMKENVSDLDEVTVIAYGERNKKELISSVSSVKAKDLEEVPSASIENLLQGHMAGVEINNVSGAPGGGGTRVAIRGYNTLMVDGVSDNTPLYVVDGVPIQSFTSPLTGTNTLAEIDPLTIESVEVLKDAASAAIYGSRASNGVILITTKHGKTGQATFQANASYSWTYLPETPLQIQGNGERKWWLWAAKNMAMGIVDRTTNQVTWPTSPEQAFMTSGQYDYFWGNGLSDDVQNKVPLERLLQDSLNPFYNNSTNWWKYVFHMGKTLNANVQASGGTERVKYMVGVGWYNEEGINIGSEFSRANLISNLNLTPRKNLTLDMRLALSYSDMSMASGGLASRNIARMTVSPKSTSTLLPNSGAAYDKMYKTINEVSEKKYNFNIRSNVRLAYKIIEGLDVSASVAVDYAQSQLNRFEPSVLDANYGLSKSYGQMKGSVLFQTEELLHYNFSLKERHNFDWLFGFSYTREAVNGLEGSGRGAPSDYIHYVVAGMPDLKDLNGTTTAMKTFFSSFTEKKMVSVFGRLAYNFDRKYLMEFTLRRDGSSVFGKDVRWATFPSIALGWNFSDEEFMKNFWWLSHGKIRGSWGKSGQTFLDPYLAQGSINVGSSFLGVTGLVPAQMENRNLTWEKSDQYDLGLDVDLLDYRVKLKLDYYYKYTSSLLWQTSLPGTVYLHTKIWDNALEISNEGIELEAQFDILRDTGVKWRARFNVSRNWNRLEKTYTGMDVDSKYVVGRSANELQVYKNLGYAQSDSDIPKYWDQQGNYQALGTGGKAQPTRLGMNVIADLNGDGIISDEDMYFAASTLPLAYGGFANEIKWKGFDLNLLFTYSLGRNMINMYRKGSLNFNPMNIGSSILEDYRNVTFWEKPGDESDYPVISAINYYHYGQFDALIDSNIEKVNFLRLKQLTLGYNLPVAWAKKIYLQGLRVFFTGENLFLWTNYSGVDPENVDPMEGLDRMENYPSARKLTLGVTLKF